MEKTKYDFPVELQEILTLNPVANGGDTIKGKKAVVRQDTGKVLGIVSDKYEVLRHSDVIEGFRTALRGQDVDEKISMAKNGAHLFAQYKLNAIRAEIKKGDFVALQFIVKNSYDGTNSLQLSLGALRLVCTNGMVISKRFFAYTVRHIGAGVNVDVIVLAQKISMLIDQFKNALPLMQKMAEQKMAMAGTEHAEQYFDKEKISLPVYLLEEAKNEYEKAGDFSVWGWYNALTFAVTHKMKKQSPQRVIEYSRIAWDVASKAVK